MGHLRAIAMGGVGAIAGLAALSTGGGACSPFSAGSSEVDAATSGDASDATPENGSTSSSSGSASDDAASAIDAGAPFCRAEPPPSVDFCWDFGGDQADSDFDGENINGTQVLRLDDRAFLSPHASLYSHIGGHPDQQSLARVVQDLGPPSDGTYEFRASLRLTCDGHPSMTVLELFCQDPNDSNAHMLVGVGLRAGGRLSIRARQSDGTHETLETEYPQNRWFDVRVKLVAGAAATLEYEVDGQTGAHGSLGTVRCTSASIVFLVGLQGKYTTAETCTANIDNVTLTTP